MLKQLLSQTPRSDAATFETLPAASPLADVLSQLTSHITGNADLPPAAIVAEVGPTPGREAISRLGEKIGLPLKWSDWSDAAKNSAFYLAFAKSGGVYALRTYTRTSATVMTPAGDRTVALADLQTACLSTLAQLDVQDPRLVGRKPSDKDQPDILKWSLGQIWVHHRKAAGQLFAASLLSNMFMLALPMFIMAVYDRVIPHSAFESLQTLAIGMGLVLAADSALRFAKLKFVDAIALSLARPVQQHLYHHLLALPMGRKPASAAPLATVHQEIDGFSTLVPETAIAGSTDITFAFVVLSLIAYIGGPLVFVPLTGMMIAVLLIISTAKTTHGLARQSVQMRGAVSGMIHESCEALGSVKVTNAEPHLALQFERLGLAVARSNHEARHRLRFSSALAGVTIQATVVATIIGGVLRIDSGAMSIGALAAITILVGRGVAPVVQITDQWCRLRAGKAVIDNAMSAIDEQEEDAINSAARHVSSISGAFTLRRVTVQHTNAVTPALSNIDLNIAAGERIGVIGRNGSGKSTLLQLLPRLVVPQSGNASIDGHDAAQFSPRWLRRHVGYMPQETVLFHRSLRENICLGQTEVSEEAFLNAVTLSGVDRFAKVHPKGYDMDVGPRGDYLSAGERQAVGFARLLLLPKKVLVLDEPTSLMDQTAESHIIDTLRTLPTNTTLIISTHRLKLLNVVSRVVTIDSGRIVGDGPTAELLLSMKAAA